MRIGPKWGWFLGFSAVFAALAAFVFWGCWATNVTFIAPDDPISFRTAYGDILVGWLNGFLTTGRVLPTDILWSGLFGTPLFCRELKYAVAIYCAALGMAYFLRGRGLSRMASYGAGLLLAFCGYWFTLFSAGHGGWFVWMTYGVFAFGLIDRAVSGGKIRHWLLLGLVIAWGSFHQPDLWLMFTAFTGAYFVFCVAVERPSPKPLLLGVAVSAVVFALVGSASIRYAFAESLAGRQNQIAESKGSSLSGGKEVANDDEARWIFVTNWSLPPAEAAEFVDSRVNGDTSCPFVLSINGPKGVRPYAGALGRPYKAKQGNYRQHSLYVGWVTCLLAFAGIILSMIRPPNHSTSRPPNHSIVVFFAVAAVFFFLLSLGRNCGSLYRLIYVLPFGDSMRAPVKWHHLTEFCLCVLAGFGISVAGRWLDAFAKGNARLALSFKCALVALVFWGAADLAVEARRFCAPVDYSKAVRSGCKSDLTVLSRRQFQDPGVAEAVRLGRIVSVASWLGNPDAYLVQYLEPMKPASPAKPKPLPLALGIVSVLSAVIAAGVAVSRRFGATVFGEPGSVAEAAP